MLTHFLEEKKIEWMKDRLLWLYESLILVDLLLGQGFKNILHMLNLKKKAKGTNGTKKYIN